MKINIKNWLLGIKYSLIGIAIAGVGYCIYYTVNIKIKYNKFKTAYEYKEKETLELRAEIEDTVAYYKELISEVEVVEVEIQNHYDTIKEIIYRENLECLELKEAALTCDRLVEVKDIHLALKDTVISNLEQDIILQEQLNSMCQNTLKWTEQNSIHYQQQVQRKKGNFWKGTLTGVAAVCLGIVIF